MSGVPVRDGDATDTSLTETDAGVKGRGRTRYCKKCKFTCTDAREFTAHQATHANSEPTSKEPPSSGITSAAATALSNLRRAVRAKRNSKNSIVEQRDIAMESPEGAKMPPPTGTGSEEAEISDTVSSKVQDAPQKESAEDLGDVRSSKSVITNDEASVEGPVSKVNNSEEQMEQEEDDNELGDEPDAMITADSQTSSMKLHKAVTDDVEKLRKGYINNYNSGEEDMDEEGRLVIDDEDENEVLSQTPLSRYGAVQNHSYSCSQCDFVTTSSKQFLYHLNELHNAEITIYDCDTCNYATKYKQKLLRHRKLHFSSRNIERNASFNVQDSARKVEESRSFVSAPLSQVSARSTPEVHIVKEEMEEDIEESGTPVFNRMATSLGHSITADNIDQAYEEDKKKKKKTRQEVDPGKYFEAVDGSGTKYACSQCGNIYKWRKSLNKHWKEKHSQDPLVEEATSPGMLELLKSGKYTQLGTRRLYDNNFLATIKTNKDDNPSRNSRSPSNHASPSPSPPNFLNSSQTQVTNVSRLPMIPKMIGPYITSTVQPVFPGMPITVPQISQSSCNSPVEGALDLTRDSIKSEQGYLQYSAMAAMGNLDTSTSLDQDQPLDFSTKKGGGEAKQYWNGLKHSPAVNQMIARVHRCSKCDYTSTSEVDFANHTSTHMNRKISVCYECKHPIGTQDELNSHFFKEHNKKLTEYKEAIKKIPHGLQQTYHLIKMDLRDIGELNNQDMGSSDAKSLKCKKCDFEAKWPAELQKHAVSHSEERPYVCMVCGSTYKWKWDLVKHFQKSHPNLSNPYRRNDKRDSPESFSEDEDEDEPEMKRPKLDGSGRAIASSQDDSISVEGIIRATQEGQRLVSNQPNLLDDEPSMIDRRNMALVNVLPYAAANGDYLHIADMQARAQKAISDAIKSHQENMGDVESDRNGGRSRDMNRNGNHDRKDGSGDGSRGSSKNGSHDSSPSKKEELPYKCTQCSYHARWPSEVTQHMKNHSDSKPYLCPRCDYRSKWKWDVVKHLKRCGGGGIEDVIDTTKGKKKDSTASSNGPPNAVVSQQGKVKKTTPQPHVSYIVPSIDENGQPAAMVVRPSPSSSASLQMDLSSGNESSQNNNQSRSSSTALDTTINNLWNEANGNNANNNNNDSMMDNNVNNNYAAYHNGQPAATSLSLLLPASSSQFVPIAPASVSCTPNSNTSVATSYTTPVSSSGGTSRQSSSAEIWNCPHCAFTTQSQAELKRHSGLHSDDKPFKCDVCMYSTRWACDLKKHRKSYNHYSRQNESGENKSAAGSPAVKQIKSCRFKCSQCTIFFQSLDSLLEHRRLKHTEERDSAQSSPAPLTLDNQHSEIDAARIKHPRKQMKKFSCEKCPFVCKYRNTLLRHMEQHDEMEKNSFDCFYCNAPFPDKETLLDHIVEHPNFNSKEWETFFMINEEEEQHARKPAKADVREEKTQTASLGGNDASSPMMKNTHSQEKQITESEATQARIQQILNEIPKQKPVHQTLVPNKFPCEWCPAEFVNLTAVYKHASQAHPLQLKEQDISMAAASQALAMKSTPTSSKKSPYSGEALDILKQQIAEKRNQQLAEKISDMVTSNPKLQEVLNKRLEEEKQSHKRYQCDKCTFCSSNYTTYLHHYELHGSKLGSRCWFCDFSVDQAHLLYQHMKISHARKWKAVSQDPKYAAEIQRMSQAFAGSGAMGNSNDAPPESSGAMDLSSKKQSVDMGHDITYCHKRQYTWSGIPVNVTPIDNNALIFACPLCPYSDASIAKTCSHVMQSHRAMAKYVCKKCKFSENNIHAMSDHCRNHAYSERAVNVLDFKQLTFAELQTIQLTAMKDKPPQSSVSPTLSNANIISSVYGEAEKEEEVKLMSCPFCPFKSDGKKEMKTHLSNHSRTARYGCQICDFSSDSTTIIREHIKVHPELLSPSQNSVKEESMEAASASKSIVKDEPLDMKINTEPENGNNNNNDTDLSKDSSPRSKTNGRIRYRCSVCPYHTTCKSNILKHKRQHQHTKRYKCTKCSYSAARAVLLKNHMEAHDTPVETDSQHHDIFCDPNNSNDDLKLDENEDTEMEIEEGDDDDTTSDDLESEMDAKAIADLEAKDILEAEAAHRASHSVEDEEDTAGDSAADRQFRKQKCNHCPFSSNSMYEFNKHQNFHIAQNRFKCDRCTYSINRQNLLTQHRRLHADEPGFHVTPEPSTLLNTSFILQHESGLSVEEKEESEMTELDTTDTAGLQYCCGSCPYKTNKKSSLDIHSNSHGSRKRFICDFCDWSADRMALMYQHRKVHENEPTYDASPEDKIFLNSEFDDGASGEFEAKFMEIKNVEKTVKEGESDASSPPFKLTVVKKSYPCSLCPYKTSAKDSFEVHKSLHGSGEEFACTECSYAAANRGLLQQHMHLHENNASPKAACSKSLLSTSINSQDKAVSPGPNPSPLASGRSSKEAVDSQGVLDLSDGIPSAELKCERCPFTASSQQVLSDHMKGHTGQEKQSMSCPFCDFSATSTTNMYPHIQIHFPGTKLELDAMARMLEEHAGSNNNNIKNNSNLNQNSVDNNEEDTNKNDMSQSPCTDVKPVPAVESQVIKTKIYVCQYCEREFEAKALMIQHEKQHLGSH